MMGKNLYKKNCDVSDVLWLFSSPEYGLTLIPCHLSSVKVKRLCMLECTLACHQDNYPWVFIGTSYTIAIFIYLTNNVVVFVTGVSKKT